MTFTDDDLKRLKELIPQSNPLPSGVNNLWYKLGPLFARLEAAEKIVNRMCVHAGPWRGKLDDCFKDDVKVWRKAAGKSL